MGDRLAIHISSLQSIDWDTSPAKSGTNDYMEVLVKETVTLHKLLSRYLSASVVEVSVTLLSDLQRPELTSGFYPVRHV